MTLLAYLAFHVSGAVVGYYLLRASWLRTLDYTRADRLFIAFFAALTGPCAPGIGLAVLVGDMCSRRGDEVLISRREDRQ